MIINKKQRDVKFIIYQSLYILVIAMLGAKHVPINNIPDPIDSSQTIVQKIELDSLRNIAKSLESKIAVDTSVSYIGLKDSNKNLVVQIDTTLEIVILKSQIPKAISEKPQSGTFTPPSEGEEAPQNPRPILVVGPNNIPNKGTSVLRIRIRRADGSTESISISPGDSESFVINKGDKADWKYD